MKKSDLIRPKYCCPKCGANLIVRVHDNVYQDKTINPETGRVSEVETTYSEWYTEEVTCENGCNLDEYKERIDLTLDQMEWVNNDAKS